MAPEVFTDSYKEKCDIWSCGVMLYQLLSNSFPFEAKDEVDLKTKLLRGTYDTQTKVWSKISKEAIDLIQKMLEKDPQKRISAKEALSHDWFKNNEQKNHDEDIERAINGALYNILEFTAKSLGKISIYSYFAKELLTKDEQTVVSKIFKKLDKEGDGTMSVIELVKSVKKYLPEKNDAANDSKMIEDLEKVFKMINIGKKSGKMDEITYS